MGVLNEQPAIIHGGSTRRRARNSSSSGATVIPVRVSLDPLRWGLNPYWSKDPKGGRKPINAKAETVARLPMFRDAYARRRCVLPVDGFFEWKAIKGAKAKQPFAIAMKDGLPIGIAGIWENWKEPTQAVWQRTFAIITVPPNELLAQIHDRMNRMLAGGLCGIFGFGGIRAKPVSRQKFPNNQTSKPRPYNIFYRYFSTSNEARAGTCKN